MDEIVFSARNGDRSYLLRRERETGAAELTVVGPEGDVVLTELYHSEASLIAFTKALADSETAACVVKELYEDYDW